MKKLWLLLLCCLGMASVAEAASRPVMLETAQQQVTAEFERLDAGLRKAAGELGKTGLTGDQARLVLASACEEFSYAVDCGTIDVKGRLITIEPPSYRSFEGKDISGQEQVKRMLQQHKPVLSAVFRSVEGYDAVDAEYPVFSSQGRFVGAVSVMFKPEKFLGKIIKPLVKGVPLDIWVMERGGRILYDVDHQQVGLNLFSSPLYRPYKQLMSLVKKIAKTPQGEGVYRFKQGTVSGADVDKRGYWQSVGLYGTAWRLVAIHLEPNARGERTGRPASVVSAQQTLERFAANADLITALADDKQADAMQQLRKYYDATPGIYSVQWIDAKGINRFGYPVENSLSGYDYHAGSAARDQEILQLLTKQQPADFEAPLFEGRTGVFVFTPLFREGRYLGMVYSIKLKTE